MTTGQHEPLTLVTAREMARKAVLVDLAARSETGQPPQLGQDFGLAVAKLAEFFMVESTGVLDGLEAATEHVARLSESYSSSHAAMAAARKARDAAMDEVNATVLAVHQEVIAAQEAQKAAGGKWDFKSVTVVECWPQRRAQRRIAAAAAAADPEWAAAAAAHGISTARAT